MYGFHVEKVPGHVDPDPDQELEFTVASDVKIIKADGTVETKPAYTKAELGAILGLTNGAGASASTQGS